MVPHRAPVVAALLSAALLVGGCDGTPGPVKSTPLFATEEEAFAAAEATYRAYVDALNAERTNPNGESESSAFLTGAALEEDMATDRALEERGWQIVGESQVAGFTGMTYSATAVSATLCLDATATQIRDKQGIDVTPPDREARLSLLVSFVTSDGGLLIADSNVSAREICE